MISGDREVLRDIIGQAETNVFGASSSLHPRHVKRLEAKEGLKKGSDRRLKHFDAKVDANPRLGTGIVGAGNSGKTRRVSVYLGDEFFADQYGRKILAEDGKLYNYNKSQSTSVSLIGGVR